MMLFLPLAILVFVHACHAAEWNYEADSPHGPSHWKGECQTGREQSPIDLDPMKAIKVCNWPDLELTGYNQPITSYNIKNNGHTAVVHMEFDEGKTPQMKGGKLPNTYNLAQFHFHWGRTNDVGSEHTVMGFSYPLELHLVHLKEGSEDPLSERDGAAVLGIFFKVDNSKENTWFNKLTDQMFNIIDPKSEVDSNAEFQLDEMFPSDMRTFYRYEGSLTTPGCNEAVMWTVLKEPVSITQAQLDAFRELLDAENKPMFNYRPVQPLNNRKLYLRDGACTKTTPATTPTRQGTNTCFDQHQWCPFWSQLGQCVSNPVYMLDKCRFSCAQCVPVSGRPTACVNTNELCDYWAKQGECTRNQDYMLRNCITSCFPRECAASGLFQPTSCVDIEPACPTWAALGECARSAHFMQWRCRASCRLC